MCFESQNDDLSPETKKGEVLALRNSQKWHWHKWPKRSFACFPDLHLHVLPNLTVVSCGIPLSTNVISVREEDQQYNDSTPVTIHCRTGHRVDGGQAITFGAVCQASGQWSGLRNCTGRKLFSADDNHSPTKYPICNKCGCRMLFFSIGSEFYMCSTKNLFSDFPWDVRALRTAVKC